MPTSRSRARAPRLVAATRRRRGADGGVSPWAEGAGARGATKTSTSMAARRGGARSLPRGGEEGARIFDEGASRRRPDGARQKSRPRRGPPPTWRPPRSARLRVARRRRRPRPAAAETTRAPPRRLSRCPRGRGRGGGAGPPTAAARGGARADGSAEGGAEMLSLAKMKHVTEKF